MSERRDLLRALPAVDRLLAHGRMQALLGRCRRDYVVHQCRVVLDEIRRDIRDEDILAIRAVDAESIVGRVEQRIARARESGLVPVVNATGTVLHTNLGRALLPRGAVEAVQRAASAPVDLEYDLAKGARGRREQRIETLLVDLTGAEAATVVNNNAAAVLLALNTLANGREVIVSRGELIEIGGAFRIPEIMASSGAALKEVGTTNRTHAADYERAISDRTGLLLKVHTSNYRVVGFVSEVSLAELAEIGRRHRIPVMEDLGSGALIDLAQFGLPKEPVVVDRVAMGADVVSFSGDKVLGGPQAGLIVGREQWIRPMRGNPLHRALRCSKFTVAALEATMQVYRESGNLAEDIPTLRMFTRPIADLERLGEQIVPALQQALGSEFRVWLEDSTAQVGSGALPTDEMPSRAIAIRHERIGASEIAARFRAARPPIIGRINGDRFILDLRTIFEPSEIVPNWNKER